MSQPPTQITFNPMPPMAGRTITRLVTQETDLALVPRTAAGDPMPINRTTRARYLRRELILDVVNGVAMRQQVTFVDETAEADTNGDVERSTGPLAGRAFVIERRTDGRRELRVTEPSGIPARLIDESAVALEYPDFGLATGFERVLPTGPQYVGDGAPALLQSIIDGFSGRQKTVEAPLISLAEIHREGDVLLGVYRFSVRVVVPSPDATVTMDLKGAMTVRDRDGEVAELVMNGPITLEPGLDAQGVALGTPGTGEFRLTEKRSYN